MSIFSNAQNFQVTGGEFHSHYHNSSVGIDILLEASAPEAAIESEEVYQRTCCPGTREQYIEDITNWATASYDVEPIYWMRGPAGVGKSSVAATCAQNLQKADHLGAAFFFSVNGRRSNHMRFFPSLSFQLTTVFSEYRNILNHKISFNKSIVKMSMPSQFKTLIVEPLQLLERLGKPVSRRTIFIDGLDECKKKEAQVEIIEIIAESVRTKSTPFQWVIFSREEPCIVAAFQDDNISPHCHFAYLPISRDIDGEIELYLRNEFRHILKRRNLLDKASSWPTDEDFRKLVNAAAGLFAHPAAVTRFVDSPSDWRIQERLQVVLDAILHPEGHRQTSPFAELDAFYMLVMQQIPPTILPSVQLLLCRLVTETGTMDEIESSDVALHSALLGISETEFIGISQQLHAVLYYGRHVDWPFVSAVNIDRTRAFFDQGSSYGLSHFHKYYLLEIHGQWCFYHRSFSEFLADPVRSSTFCVTTSAMRERLFDCFVNRHSHFSSSYALKDSKLTLAPGITSSSSSLSWPRGSEFVDSFLKLQAFRTLSANLSPDCSDHLLENVSFESLQKLEGLDYQKDLSAKITYLKYTPWWDQRVVGYEGKNRVLSHTVFECIQSEKFKSFNPIAFIAMVEKLEQAGVIRPHHTQLGSSRAASVIHTLSPLKSHGKSSCRYKLGHGDKSVVWYWEFDMEKQYFHQFRTLNFSKAMKIYKKDKFAMWEDEWVKPSS